MARDGATPTRFGPNPLNKALGPSFSTISLEGNRKNACDDSSVEKCHNPENSTMHMHGNSAKTVLFTSGEQHKLQLY